MTRFTTSRMAASVAVIAMISVLVALPTAASATTVAGPPGCVATISADSHSATVKCSGLAYHGKAYRVVGNACNVGGCSAVGSGGMVAYGTTVTLNGGGNYFASNSFSYKWAATTATPSSQWCSFTSVGGAVAWCDMQASIQYWAGTAQPVYNQNAHTANWYHDRDYRTDCSGLVSMAWHVDANSSNNWGYWTGSLDDASVSKPVTFAYGTTSAYIHPGDVLDNTIDGHAVVFAGWASDHVHFSVWSFGDGTMSNGHLFTGQPYTGTPPGYSKPGLEVAGWYKANYKAYRYVHSTGTSFG